jgi:hypothetical protein
MLAHVLHAIDYPLDVGLGATRDVAKNRGVVRSHDRPQVGKAGELDAEVGPWSVGPMLFQRSAAFTANIHAQQLAGDAAKPGFHDNFASAACTMLAEACRAPKEQSRFSELLADTLGVYLLQRQEYRRDAASAPDGFGRYLLLRAIERMETGTA